MVRMNFIFIFISSSDTNLFRKKSVKQKIKKRWPYLVSAIEKAVLFLVIGKKGLSIEKCWQKMEV